MQAASITEHEESLLVDKDGAKFLPVAVLYGPNGGGKSTVLDALNSLIWKVIRPILAALHSESYAGYQATENKPFLFDGKSISQPTEYEIFFRTKSTQYRYQLHILNDIIVYETLYKKTIEGRKYSEVFTRKDSSDIALKGTLRSYKVAEISDTLPLLSYLGIVYQNNEVIKDATSWFVDDIGLVNFLISLANIKFEISNLSDTKELVLKMLKEMDVDIVDFREEKLSNDKIKVYIKHFVEGKEYELEMSEESSGTIKLFNILPYIIVSLQLGLPLIIDELDSKLHPLLLKYIISLYIDPEKNRKKAQLLFTSHDLSTMSNEIFRRDEIWFVAKDGTEATHMYSLVEFKDDGGKIRKDAVYGKQYLEGRYGADPYLKKIINWEDVK